MAREAAAARAAQLREADIAKMGAGATGRARVLRTALRRWRQRCWLAWRLALLEDSAARAQRMCAVRRWQQHARQAWQRALLAAGALSRRRRRWLQRAWQRWVRGETRAAVFGSQLVWGCMSNAPSWARHSSPKENGSPKEDGSYAKDSILCRAPEALGKRNRNQSSEKEETR